MKNTLSKDDIKGRVWGFVLYPESCLEYCEMIKKLNYLGVPLAVSPLHLPEKNKIQENEKKPHYHCLMYFDGQKKQSQLKKLCDMSTSSYDRQYFDWHLLVDKNNVNTDFAKYPFFMKINSIRQQTRYLLHLDDENKQQFPDYKICSFVSDDEQKYNHLVLLNGYNVRDYMKSGNINPDKQILELVKENNFRTINELITNLVYANNDYLLSYIKHNMNYISKFLLADLFFFPRNTRKQDINDLVNQATE